MDFSPNIHHDYVNMKNKDGEKEREGVFLPGRCQSDVLIPAVWVIKLIEFD